MLYGVGLCKATVYGAAAWWCGGVAQPPEFRFRLLTPLRGDGCPGMQKWLPSCGEVPLWRAGRSGSQASSAAARASRVRGRMTGTPQTRLNTALTAVE